MFTPINQKSTVLRFRRHAHSARPARYAPGAHFEVNHERHETHERRVEGHPFFSVAVSMSTLISSFRVFRGCSSKYDAIAQQCRCGTPQTSDNSHESQLWDCSEITSPSFLAPFAGAEKVLGQDLNLSYGDWPQRTQRKRADVTALFLKKS